MTGIKKRPADNAERFMTTFSVLKTSLAELL